MNYGEAVCDNPECRNGYIKKTSNQRYCGEYCRKTITNQNLKDRYHNEQDRKRGKIRFCSHCQETRLSRYNSSDICNKCAALEKKTRRDNLLAMFNGV